IRIRLAFSAYCPDRVHPATDDVLMRAMAIEIPAPIETSPLRSLDIEKPSPRAGEILVRVRACGVCRTDLHVAEGELAPKHRRMIPGHEVVGVVDAIGE